MAGSTGYNLNGTWNQSHSTGPTGQRCSDTFDGVTWLQGCVVDEPPFDTESPFTISMTVEKKENGEITDNEFRVSANGYQTGTGDFSGTGAAIGFKVTYTLDVPAGAGKYGGFTILRNNGVPCAGWVKDPNSTAGYHHDYKEMPLATCEPIPESIHVYLNGVEQYQPQDWALMPPDSTHTSWWIRTEPAMEAEPGDLLEARYVCKPAP